MAFSVVQATLSTANVPAQIAISTAAKRSNYIYCIGGTAWLNPSSTGGTSGFPLSSVVGVFRLDGAQASDALWAVSTAAGPVVYAYQRN